MNKIKLKGITHHNLKNIDIEIPHNQFTVISGVSGSGKSTLAEEVIYKDAERRYLETYSVHARQLLNKLRRPEAEHISGLRPAILLQQKNFIVSPRSTVGTLTEIHDLLRLFYARIGKTIGKEIEINRSLFSFNRKEGACPVCNGLGVTDKIDPDLLISDPTKTLREGVLVITTPSGYIIYSQVTMDVMAQVCESEGFSVDTPWQDLTDYQKDVVFYGSSKIRIPFGKHTLESRMKWKGITAKPRDEGYYKGIIPIMDEILKRDRNPNILRFARTMECGACRGSRYNEKALNVTIEGKNIADLSTMSFKKLKVFFCALKFTSDIEETGKYISKEILNKIEILEDLGLDYLSLNRNAQSLSGGEAARIRLGNQINSELHGILYVFDEPAAGLHAFDLDKLLIKIKGLSHIGNTVIAVDHNEQIIREADYIVDLGPLAGNSGGEIIARGTYSQILDCKESITAKYLRNDNLPFYRKQKPLETLALKIKNASANNLKNIDIEFYASGINILTGSSGSGKSSLLFDVLYNSILHKRPVNCDFIELYAIFEQVIAVNQDTPSVSGLSSPVTFCGIFDYIRDEFAKEAKKMDSQIGKSYFSPNSPGGRCETCKGQGFLKTSLDFLPDNYSVCPDCNGRRFTREAQDFKLYEKSIADVLEMSVNEALVFFTNFPNIEHALYSLSETNLGYLKLGQSLNSLSGGELQRLKLAKEIIKPSQAKSLILLDEPTTGLHFEDVKHLLLLLDKMVKDGHTIIMTEHNPVVILNADYVIDMGPGGGDKGGKIMAHGTPFEIMEVKESLTGNYLKERYVKPN